MTQPRKRKDRENQSEKESPWMATSTREQEMNQLAHSWRNPSANRKWAQEPRTSNKSLGAES
jgi:hypothetical protein